MRSLTPLLLIAISVGLYYIHISPRYAEVQTLRSEQEQYKDALLKADELRAKRDELLTTYNTLPKEDIEKVEKLVPDKVNTVKLAADINSIAGKYGATIKNVNVTQQIVDNSQSIGGSDSTPKKPYKTTLISFRFSSSYENLVKYMQDLEKSLQVVDIQSISFQVPSDTDGSGLYEYQVSIQVYSLN